MQIQFPTLGKYNWFFESGGGSVRGVALTLCKQEKSTSCLLIQADLPCPPCLDIRDHSWQAGHWFTTWLENFNENSTAPVSWIRSPDMLSCLCKVSQQGTRLLIYHPRPTSIHSLNLKSLMPVQCAQLTRVTLICSCSKLFQSIQSKFQTIIYNLGCVSCLN